MSEKMTLDEKRRALAMWVHPKPPPDYTLKWEKAFDPFHKADDWLLVMKKVAEQDDTFKFEWSHYSTDLWYVTGWEFLDAVAKGTMMSMTMNAAGIAANLWEAKDE
jgi:hypothetical protein